MGRLVNNIQPDFSAGGAKFRSQPVYVSAQVPTIQYVGPDGGGISGRFNTSSSTATLVYDIQGGNPQYQSQLPQLIQDVLGYSYKSGTSLKRVLPKPHPELPYLWASGINSIRGVAPAGKMSTNIGGVQGGWRRIRVEVQYETPPYSIKKDGVPEYTRFMIPDPTPATEFVEIKAGQFRFVDGAPSTNKTITGGMAQILTKTRHNFKWIQVPDDGLYSGGGFDAGTGGRPTNIENALGKVNSDVWRGYPIGTLLLEGYKPIARSMPIILDVARNILMRAWDVELHILHFDPGYPDNLGDPNVRGHNLFPNPDDGRWWRAIRAIQGATDSSYFWRYQSTPFADIFNMIA